MSNLIDIANMYPVDLVIEMWCHGSINLQRVYGNGHTSKKGQTYKHRIWNVVCKIMTMC